MSKKDKQRQFKETKSHGENRNGRLAPFKNYNAEAGKEPNEYIDETNHLEK